ncbi:N-acetylglucosamine repressor [Anatilimnocola aggregata]|uniref:N-acetylglucosamine repressor n=1 Tax=Anatilimnocola aggregata TaxID=2528021 RepID=A0A517Y4J8_9BACT|nr:ROK family transcriptional regulator [Anatilimnocola aggregata]QDU25116.1 N-acetylglucosamine repressor [Anatilimnocola aggregata]
MVPPRSSGSSIFANGGKPKEARNSGAQSSLLRQLNTREVLTALQRHGPLSRAEIARHTGISGPTITRTVLDLLAGQLVEEAELSPGVVNRPALGRPGKVLRLASASVSVQGLVIGVQQCELTTAGLDGSWQAEPRTFATPKRYNDLVRKVVEQLQRSREQSKTSVLGVGISIPGLLRRQDKRTLVSPNLHQTDGQQLGVDVAERLQSLGLGNEVVLLQETQALCLGERMYGAARDIPDFAMVDITDGLGLGVVQGGQFVEGSTGLAGELGHITVDLHGRLCGCGNHGCLETVATDAALAAAISARQGRQLTLAEWLPLIQTGQVRVEQDLNEWLDYLSVGLAAVINIFNPSRLFVHGHALDAAPDLFDRLIERTARRALAPSLADCRIIRAQGSKRHGAVAAIIQQLTAGR